MLNKKIQSFTPFYKPRILASNLKQQSGVTYDLYGWRNECRPMKKNEPPHTTAYVIRTPGKLKLHGEVFKTEKSDIFIVPRKPDRKEKPKLDACLLVAGAALFFLAARLFILLS